MASIVPRVSSSIVPEIMLPSASFATWPETNTKSPARTAGWNGRFGFFGPYASIPLIASCPRELNDIEAVLTVGEIDQAAPVHRHIVGGDTFATGRRVRLIEAHLA